MRDPFAAALDAQFNAPGSAAAIYAPPQGFPKEIRVIRDQPTADLPFGTTVSPVQTNLMLIRRSDAPSAAAGDLLMIEEAPLLGFAPETVFEIAGEPRLDVEGLTWSVELIEHDY